MNFSFILAKKNQAMSLTIPHEVVKKLFKKKKILSAHIDKKKNNDNNNNNNYGLYIGISFSCREKLCHIR